MLYTRCSGYRNAYSLRGNGSTQIGFRCVNGVRVDRGGRWGLGSDYIRCSYRDRSTQSGTGGGGIIGFRLNGVYRGSCYVRTERCPRSGTKNYYYTHNMSGGTVGFRAV